MRILLDECLPKKLKFEIDAEFVQTVPEAGWASKQNGELLTLAALSFDVLLTNDQNIEHQQTVSRSDKRHRRPAPTRR